MGLNRITDPTAALLEIAEAKKHVQVAQSDTTHDATLSQLVDAATREAERYTRRAFITQTWRLTLDSFPAREIWLPRPPLQSVTSITYTDEEGNEQTVPTSLYTVDTKSTPGRVRPKPNQSWPTPDIDIAVVEIEYVAGYGAAASNVPADIIHAVKLLLARWFEEPEGGQGMATGAKHLLTANRVSIVPGDYRVTE